MVTNVHVEQLTQTSVNVSWHQIIADEITNYTVYYKPSDAAVQSESSVTVPSSESSVVIEDLKTNMVYQFQVAATAELNGVLFLGQRSPPWIQMMGSLNPTPPPTTLTGKLLVCISSINNFEGTTNLSSYKKDCSLMCPRFC